jgi:hypothetical protein
MISLGHAPLKFRAPGLQLPVGLTIDRIVFCGLIRVEAVWAILIAVCLLTDPPGISTDAAAIAGITILVVQLGVVRPALNRRSNLVLAGLDTARSSARHICVALEITKVISLIALCTQLPGQLPPRRIGIGSIT